MKKITMYRTTDGRTWASEREALEHVESETKKHIRAVLIRAAQKSDCKGFAPNYSEAFTESVFSDLMLLKSQIDFYISNMGPDDENDE
ncbi:MAG: hypothetical protein ACOYBW_08925 [Fluviibacter phosphoraccumulans]